MSATLPRPRRLSLSLTPEEAAARLRREPGMIWLDTAGNLPEADTDGGISLLTARPRAILRGDITDPRPLEEALAGSASAAELVDWGFPVSGLFGTVDYEGSYIFGLYDEMLVYRHSTEEWLGTGDTLPELLNREPLPDTDAAPLFIREKTADAYMAMVRRAKEYIAAGDIYQVNLAHAFSAEWPKGADAFAFARRLRAASAAPYAAWLDLAGRQVMSSSPESFLKMSGRVIRTRPIKGTRPRARDSRTDERAALDLMTSEKERAELLMITDLLRNDLGQVCDYGGVTVTDLLRLERYEQVFHLVSTVQGALRPGISHPAVLAACFPGGSITGAPKKRAMEIIAELEGRPRGLYTGVIGYFGSNGESQFNIAIRTVTLENGRAEFLTGAGIVADSTPELEWEETLHKAAGILAAARV